MSGKKLLLLCQMIVSGIIVTQAKALDITAELSMLANSLEILHKQIPENTPALPIPDAPAFDAPEVPGWNKQIEPPAKTEPKPTSPKSPIKILSGTPALPPNLADIMKAQLKERRKKIEPEED
jgi:hypothetical protein